MGLAPRTFHFLSSVEARLLSFPLNHRIPWNHQRVFPLPLGATLERLLATYASRKVAFRAVQVCWSSGSFEHSRVYVSYSPDCSRNFSATDCIYSSCMMSFARLDFRCAASITFMNCGIPSASLKSVFINWGISTASTVCSPKQNSVIWSRSLRAVTFL